MITQINNYSGQQFQVASNKQSKLRVTMKNRGQNYKINQIISLSQNYKLHRNSIDGTKATINSNNHKRQESIKKLAQQKLRYRQAVRNFNDRAIKNQNQALINRMFKAVQDRSKKKLEQNVRYSRNVLSRSSNKNSVSRSIQRNTSKSCLNRQKSNKTINNGQSISKDHSKKTLRSVSSSRSLSSVSSNYRQRTRKQKQIDRQNIKIAGRITNPKSIKTLALKQLNKSYEKQQQYLRIRSRFSQRNQEIIKSLAMQGLKLDKKNVQYLPQLTNKKLANRKSKSRIQWNSTLK